MPGLSRQIKQLDEELLALGEEAMLLEELDGFIAGLLIPHLSDQNPCAHWRSPMDLSFQGRSMRVFQA